MKKYNNISCIYKCESPDGKIYVGATCDYERRLDQYKAKDGLKYQKLLRESVEKHGLINHEFSIIEYCDIINLHKREIYWIGKLDSYFFNNSMGLNLTLGGHGTKGFVMSDKQKKTISERNSKKVYQYDLKGEFIREYKSSVEASLMTGVKSSDISSCCNKTRNKQTAGGFIWRRIKEEKPQAIYSFNFNTKVIQIDKNGNLIKTFDNIKKASIETGVVSQNIARCIEKKRFTAGGFYWIKESEKNIFVFKPKPKKISNKMIKINSYDKNMVLLKTFDSISEASMFYKCSAGDICQAIKENYRTVKKMYFRKNN